MLDFKEKSFAAKLFPDEEPAADAGKGPLYERGVAATATNLRIWNKSGRQAAGFSWSSYVTDQWDDSEGMERLTLIFAARYVTLWGHHLLSVVRQIDEGRLKSITELDGLQAQQVMAENASIRDETRKTPIVLRFEVRPDIKDLVSALGGKDEDEVRYPRLAR